LIEIIRYVKSRSRRNRMRKGGGSKLVLLIVFAEHRIDLDQATSPDDVIGGNTRVHGLR
jgi:hypothetical protein